MLLNLRNISLGPSDSNPFHIELAEGHRVLNGIWRTIEKVSGLHQIAHHYRCLRPSQKPGEFALQVLQYLNIGYHVFDLDKHSIPTSGPALIVANHPFGLIEGLILAHWLTRYRSDVKIMANSLLQRIPEVSDLFIGVDPYAGQHSPYFNHAPLRQTLRWLKKGGLVVVFPAGDVARFQWRKLRIEDCHWNISIPRIAKITNAPIIPLFFYGRNSLLFHALGGLHPRIRTLLLPRELLNKRNRCIALRIGEAIRTTRLKHIESDGELAHYIRLRTCVLEKLKASQYRSLSIEDATFSPGDDLNPIACAQSREALQSDILALPESQCLAKGGDEFFVYYASAEQMPHILPEIGRLRETTFRSVGEGTGKSIDLDDYDRYYLHLFIWHRAKQEIVGAYRMGLVDEILKQHGKQGLYTHSLFDFSMTFLQEILPAIELGRSFIRQEYQREFAPLLLLWKGIGHYVAANPQYARLFGPVSISNTYTSLSQQLLIDFLKANNFDWQLGQHVRPRCRFKPKPRSLLWRPTDLQGLSSVDGISELVSTLEHDRKGMPILLKQYLKLGGRILGFNVDAQFNHCLDGLILVDLRQTETRVLQRYMGSYGLQTFRQAHSLLKSA